MLLFFIYVGLMFNFFIKDINIFFILVFYVLVVFGKLIGCGFGLKLVGFFLGRFDSSWNWNGWKGKFGVGYFYVWF